MKLKFLVFLLLASLCAGCTCSEIQMGIYISSDPARFPLPLSGYSLFVVGETHGNQETKLILLAYLKRLHQATGLSDIILEESQGYESEAEAYIQGISSSLPEGLCLRTDVLTGLRNYNASLPQNGKISVHLVDLDTSINAIYTHLQELQTKMGPLAGAIQVPDYDTFKHISKDDAFAILDRFVKAAGDSANILNGLETIRNSLLLYYGGSEYYFGQGLLGTDEGILIREDGITTNVNYLLKVLNGRPALTLFGSFHTVKSQKAISGMPEVPNKQFKPWVARLVDSGVKVYSLDVEIHSGKGYWRGQESNFAPGDDKIQFADGTRLASLFDRAHDQNLLYANLKVAKNAAIHALPAVNDIPASGIYDGLILIKQATPMKNECP